MDVINKQITYECMALFYASQKERNTKELEPGYLGYHSNMSNLYFKYFDEYLNILGVSSEERTSENEVINKLNNLILSKKQEIAIKRLKREPAFIKLMGETALSKKDELEQLLGVSLNVYSGITLASDNINEPSKQVPKSLLQINKEFDSYYDKLDLLFENGTISEEQYNDYEGQLDYINSYFTSISKGEQIHLRKISDKEYENIRELANMEGISYEEMFAKINIDMMENQKYYIQDFSLGRSR